MSQAGPELELEQVPAVRNYVFLCLATLAVTLLLLLRLRLGVVSLLPVLVGLLGVTLRWRPAPILMVLLLGAILYWREARPAPDRQGTITADVRLMTSARLFSLPDWILCGAVLGYIVAQYRLQSLTTALFPEEDRGAGPGTLASEPGKQVQPRSTMLVPGLEMGWLVLSLPVWAFLAQLLAKLLPGGWSNYNLAAHQWQGILLVWILALGLFIVGGLVSYVSWGQVTPQEARLFLQDSVWQEIRRDLRRLYRWLVWQRTRPSVKEKS